MKKFLLVLVMVFTFSSVVSVASAAVAPVDGYSPITINYPQVITTGGCTIFYGHNTVHPSKGVNNGYYQKVSIWVPTPENGNDIDLTSVKVGSNVIHLCPGFNTKDGFNWKSLVVDMGEISGTEFISSKYETSRAKVGGGYLTLKFLVQKK